MEKKTFVNLNASENVIALQPNNARVGYFLNVIEGTGTVKARVGKPNVDDPTNKIQQIVAPFEATKGTFKFKSGESVSDAVAFDAGETPMLAALHSLPNFADAYVLGNFASDIAPQLSINYINVPFGTAEIEIVENTMVKEGENDVQTITFTDVPKSGFFTLINKVQVSMEGGTPYYREEGIGPFTFDASASDIQTRLRAYFGDNALTVTGSFQAGFVITHGVNEKFQTLVVAQSSGAGFLKTANQFEIAFSEVPAEGSFKIQFGKEISDELAFDISATNLQAAIRALGSKFSDVVVSADGSDFSLTSNQTFILKFVDVTLKDASENDISIAFTKGDEGSNVGASVAHTVKGANDKALTFNIYDSQDADSPDLSDSFTTTLDKRRSGQQGALYLSCADEVKVEVIEIF